MLSTAMQDKNFWKADWHPVKQGQINKFNRPTAIDPGASKYA
jgi:hypothetical protein